MNAIAVRKGLTCPDVTPYMPDKKFLCVMNILEVVF